MKKEKYVVLAVDTECGGDAFVYSIDKEELTETIGRFDSYNVECNGLKLYNDCDESYDSLTILNAKGLEKIRKEINGAKPFDAKKIKVKDYLKSEDDCDDEDDY